MRNPKKYITQTLGVIATFEAGLEKAKDQGDTNAADLIQRTIDNLHFNIGMATLELAGNKTTNKPG